MKTHNIGDRVTGRCVTMGTRYTGTVTEVFSAGGGFNARYRLADTGEHYGDGSPIEPIVECASAV